MLYFLKLFFYLNCSILKFIGYFVDLFVFSVDLSLFITLFMLNIFDSP